MKKAVESDDNDKIVGITEIYHEDVDKDSIWLSWFGVVPNERSKGEKIMAEMKILKTYK